MKGFYNKILNVDLDKRSSWILKREYQSGEVNET